jgi:hypothetical protein
MSSGSPATIVSVVHGVFHDYVQGWISNLRAVGCNLPIHLIVLDRRERSIADSAVSLEHVKVDNPAWGSGDYVRLRKIHEFCRAGRTCLQIDIDTYFNVDPALFATLPYGFIISRGMRFPQAAVRSWGFSLCTGFYIAKPEALPLIDDWLAQEKLRRGLDQEDLNLRLLVRDIQWKHAVSDMLPDAFVVSKDSAVCVLPDRAITRDPHFGSFGGIHNRVVLERHQIRGVRTKAQ